VQTDYNLLRADQTVVGFGVDSKVRSIKACYLDKASEPVKFAISLEVWTRSTNRSLWLSVIGDIGVIKLLATQQV